MGKASWKTALVVAGGAVATLVGGALVARWRLPVVDDPDADEIALVSIFDSTDLRPVSRAFQGGSIVSLFGATNLDLRRVSLASDRAHLRVVSIFGGTELTVPDGWLVTSTSRSFAGATAVESPSDLPADAPVLAISAVNLFGGTTATARPVLRTAEKRA